jgi:hypothetical protein
VSQYKKAEEALNQRKAKAVQGKNLSQLVLGKLLIFQQR